MNIVAIGDKVPPGTYHFHSRFTHVVNYRNADCIISLIDTDTGLSGRTLLVSDLPKGKGAVRVSAAHVVVGQSRLPRLQARRYDSSFAGFPPDHDLESLTHIMKSVLALAAPPRSLAVLYDSRHERDFSSTFEKALLNRFREAHAAFKNGDLVGSVLQFKGVGFGLTPSGDDFITGLLYALSSLEPTQKILQLKRDLIVHVESGLALSVQFMRDAAAGVYPRDVKALLGAARLGDAEGMKRHLLDILQHGHSSGADTIAGMIAGFEWFCSQRTGRTEERRIG